MVKRIGIVLVLAWILSGVAFADFYQQDGKPCPPECVSDTLEIMTWYPSPWNSYEELYTMKLGVGDVTTFTEAELKPNKVGSIKVGESVVFKPKDNDPDSWYSGDAEAGELVYSSQKDAFYHYNGSSWVPQAGGSSSLPVLYTACSWRYDYREGTVGIGAASNWGCIPPACPTAGGTWVDLGVTATEPLSVACSGSDRCYWDTTGAGAASYYHPVSAGRSVRACLRQ